jgi:hypothetical protein
VARGDQIYVLRELINLEGIYQHHGIDCGDGSVIHYRKPQATVERTSLEIFSQGKPISIKNYRVCYIPDVVVHRAEKRLGEQQYNLLFNNCEHFANWCKTGINESLQIRNFLPLLNQININTLSQPVQEALKGVDDDESAKLLHQALTEIKTAWDTIQPQYAQAVQETKAWDQVARKALQNKREDLARRAIQYKLTHQKRAQELEPQLNKLAQMTETLVRKRPDWLTIQTL